MPIYLLVIHTYSFMKCSLNFFYSFSVICLSAKYFKYICIWYVVLVVNNLPANTGDTRDTGLIPGLGRSPRGRNGNPLQYPCLGNSMDWGAWWGTVHGVTNNHIWLNDGTHIWYSSLVYNFFPKWPTYFLKIFKISDGQTF